MQITRELSIVMELKRPTGPPVVVRSAPLDATTFSMYFDLCGPTWDALIDAGFSARSMPRYAALMFRKVALASVGPEPAVPNDAWTRAKGMAQARVDAFFAELHRLTYVLTLKNGRWDYVLLDDARQMGIVDDKDVSRIEGSHAYFICASESVPSEAAEIALIGLSMWDARVDYLSLTDFIRSLPTSMMEDSSGASPDSSPPSSPGSQDQASSPSSPSGMHPGKAPRPSGIVLSSVSRAG